MFQKILIANRGEIACRVIRTAKHMGIRTVAVYSDSDAGAQHVQLADEAIHIGPSSPAESYLRGDTVINAARQTGAQAIHPGYGFLSENANFSRQCLDAGIVFIGPPASAIEVMGSKSAAKQAMEQAGVPLLPGYHGDNQDIVLLRSAAEDIGYPVLLKAVAGGGGKGMRQVVSASEFDDALAAAKREAASSFGNDTMLVEKYLQRPRHVEVQVFCDTQGNGVYLFERDCSVQRRHQKIIEEAPAPGISDELRSKMGESALQAAQAVDYVGAGTVEFLLDGNGDFYFMEMNTRLQVEHPVTEMITGQDLVAWQLMIANNERLPCTQDDLCVSGHSFEARIYAEDPYNEFLPASGRLDWLQQPAQDPNIRVDTGVTVNDEVGVFYDPMIAKLIVWGENRSQALARLHQALSEYQIAGVTTNIQFLKKIAESDAFRDGDISTDFIERNQEALFEISLPDPDNLVATAVLALALQQRKGITDSSPWQQTDYWRPNLQKQHTRTLDLAGETTCCDIIESSDHEFTISSGELRVTAAGELSGNELRTVINGQTSNCTVFNQAGAYTVFSPDGTFSFHEVMPDLGEELYHDDGTGFKAPMNGTIVDILCTAGERVEAGEILIIMEAMKMEHSIRAPSPGTVNEIYFSKGDLVDGGAALIGFTPDSAD
jgi:3-methylcrotonyl-CoA carboxylase alpha subunit